MRLVRRDAHLHVHLPDYKAVAVHHGGMAALASISGGTSSARAAGMTAAEASITARSFRFMLEHLPGCGCGWHWYHRPHPALSAGYFQNRVVTSGQPQNL
jgi:hypothetical protein